MSEFTFGEEVDLDLVVVTLPGRRSGGTSKLQSSLPFFSVMVMISPSLGDERAGGGGTLTRIFCLSFKTLGIIYNT